MQKIQKHNFVYLLSRVKQKYKKQLSKNLKSMSILIIFFIKLYIYSRLKSLRLISKNYHRLQQRHFNKNKENMKFLKLKKQHYENKFLDYFKKTQIFNYEFAKNLVNKIKLKYVVDVNKNFLLQKIQKLLLFFLVFIF